MSISVNQCQSVSISVNQWQSEAIRGNQQALSMQSTHLDAIHSRPIFQCE